MKGNMIRKFALAIALLLIFAQLMSIGVFADDYEPEWIFEDDELYFGNEKYVSVIPQKPVYFVATDVIYYELEEYFGSIWVQVNATDEEMHIAWLDIDTEGFYVSADGKKHVDAFFDGEADSYLICSGEYIYHNGAIGIVTVDALDSAYNGGAEKIKVDVRDLKNLSCYSVLAVDSTGTLGYEHGVIYDFDDGTHGYISYDALGNQYFDADGNFSFRNGEVEVAIIEGTLLSDVLTDANNMEYNAPNYISSDDEDDFGLGSGFFAASAVVIFWFCYILLGFILPLPFIIVGLILPRIKKLGKPKYWYIMSICAGAWLVLCAILLVVILLIV